MFLQSTCLQHGWPETAPAQCVCWALRTASLSTPRREVQEYIPAQLCHTMAGSAWLNLVSQDRQQTQALSPHQARAQFLGKNPGLGEITTGGFAEKAVLESGGRDTFFCAQRHFQC